MTETDPVSNGNATLKSNQARKRFRRVLDDIDLDEALNRLRGNHRLLMELLKNFTSGYRRKITEIGEAIDRGDQVAARNSLHAIRGVAGNLSAIGIEQAAKELGAAFKQGDRKLARIKFQEFSAAFDRLSASVKEIESPTDPEVNKGPEKDAPPCDSEAPQLAGILFHLNELLMEFNIEAEFYLESVMPELSRNFSKDELETFGQKLADLEYKSAAKDLAILARRVGVSLDPAAATPLEKK